MHAAMDSIIRNGGASVLAALLFSSGCGGCCKAHAVIDARCLVVERKGS